MAVCPCCRTFETLCNNRRQMGRIVRINAGFLLLTVLAVSPEDFANVLRLFLKNAEGISLSVVLEFHGRDSPNAVFFIPDRPEKQ
ncbi:hypothetical protein L596_020558 [Steinernema carpocapsae]|uniref:Uncharacterized protein n=1 Tax=Steinernema carpocapsae TaxID=34508 RepID=A0A4U5MUN5_STECR|nr:hypothetical protein L596_020558 [Steinernema carpocapsae]